MGIPDMNKDSVIISTLEKLHERIARLEMRVSNNGKIGTFISAGDPTEEFAREIVRHAVSWFKHVQMDLDPSDLFQMAQSGMEVDVPNVQQVNDLAAFIRSRRNSYDAYRLYIAVTKDAERLQPYFRSDLLHGVKTAIMTAYDIVPRASPSGPGHDGWH
jgi:hypothetical protein